jgi:hypothetical protein
VREKSLDRFEIALKDKKIPIVTLDHKWYILFDKNLRTFTLTNLEKKLNKLLRRQGQLYNDLKEMEIAKKTLMDKILDNMDPNEDAVNGEFKIKKLDASQRLIKDLNAKITSGEQELENLPDEIDQVNKRLLIEGMSICYDAMKTNKKNIEAINTWIEEVRNELKNNVVRKQEIQDETNQIYSYMHDILGFEVLDVFDLYHEEVPSEE